MNADTTWNRQKFRTTVMETLDGHFSSPETSSAAVLVLSFGTGERCGSLCVSKGVETARLFAALVEEVFHLGEVFHLSRAVVARNLQELAVRELADDRNMTDGEVLQ